MNNKTYGSHRSDDLSDINRWNGTVYKARLCTYANRRAGIIAS